MSGACGADTARRRLGAALALCLVLPVAGCTAASGGGGSSELGLKPVTEASSGALPTTGLGEVALSAGDVAGYTVTAPDAGETVRQRDVRLSDAACAPVAYALAGTVVGKSSATQIRQAAGQHPVTVVLASYDEVAAPAALEALSEAADTCADGFTATVDGHAWRITDVAPRLAPEGADQAMALGALVERDGREARLDVVVLRKGGTVAYLSASGEDRADGGPDTSVPAAVLNAQLAELG
ncbi:hypothetical protein ABZZ80_03390 [Streptomyces sp. NPDC006356]